MPLLPQTDAYVRLAKALRNWQLVAFFLAAADVVLAAGMVRLALTTRYVPYLVEADAHGNTVYAGPIEALDAPEERLIVQQLAVFLWNLFILVDDPPAQAELLARAYTVADAPLRHKLNEILARPENDPRLLAPRLARTVEDITILRLPETDSTYEVQWRELSRDRRSLGTTEVRTFRGLIRTARATKLSPEALAANPLGLLVTDFTWTETTRHR